MTNTELKPLIISWFNHIEKLTQSYEEMNTTPEQMHLEVGAMANRCRQFIEKYMEEK